MESFCAALEQALPILQARSLPQAVQGDELLGRAQRK